MSSLHLLTSRSCLNSTADYAAQLEARAMASNLQTLWGSIGKNHWRLIKTEEKAKVVSAVWGTELIQFLAVLAILHQDDLKQEMTS